VADPPVDPQQFYFDSSIVKGNYFIAAGRLMHYKRFDLVIDAFNRLRLPLVIAGTGPEYARLRRAATSPHIAFAGFVPDDKLRRLYAGARAFVFPQVEDFGLVGVEAMACGTPLIAIRAGGAAEIAEEGTTGVFFDTPSTESLVGALYRFAAREAAFKPAMIAASAASRFSLAAFAQGLRANLALLR
jgi:glycosyltransferase involved in cell wall biosynthesis